MNRNIHNFFKAITLTISFLFTSAFANGLAPDIISGFSINFVWTDDGSTDSRTFSDDGKVYDDNSGEWTYYIYEKTSENVARISYTFSNEPNPQPEAKTLIFTSENGGTYDWVEYTNSSKITQNDI